MHGLQIWLVLIGLMLWLLSSLPSIHLSFSIKFYPRCTSITAYKNVYNILGATTTLPSSFQNKTAIQGVSCWHKNLGTFLMKYLMNCTTTTTATTRRILKWHIKCQLKKMHEIITTRTLLIIYIFNWEDVTIISIVDKNLI